MSRESDANPDVSDWRAGLVSGGGSELQNRLWFWSPCVCGCGCGFAMLYLPQVLELNPSNGILKRGISFERRLPSVALK